MSAAIENTAAPFDKEQLLAAFRSLSAEDMAGILEEMQRGMDLWRARQPDAEVPIAKSSKPAAASASAPDRRAKERKPRAAAEKPAALPAADGEAPSAASYRVASVKESVCMGRRTSESTKDARWKPSIYGEEQCGRAVETGSDLCPVCKNRLTRYTENPSDKIGWLGRVSEEPLDWMHMLGTAWAAKANPRFGSGSACASEAASVASAPAAAAAAAAAKPGRKSKQTEEEKEAAAAAKAAEKATKDAAKEAAKAAKEAEKAAVKAATAAAVQKVKDDAAAKKAAAAPAAAAAKADTATPAATVAHKIVCVAGEMYAVRGSNAFAYDPMDDSMGDYVGRLSADGNAVDTEAAEEE